MKFVFGALENIYEAVENINDVLININDALENKIHTDVIKLSKLHLSTSIIYLQKSFILIVCNLIANLHHYKDGYFMKQNNTTKQLMQLYFGKQFSKYGRILFGRWLKADNEKLEKIEILKDLWKESRSDITTSTYEDWQALQYQLPHDPIRKYSVPLYRQWIKYVAIFVLILTTAVTTYWLTDHLKPLHLVEMTEVFVPYGDSRKVLLPDGSNVWVDAGSLLIYPKDFTNTDTRTVYLTGEASFSVYKNQKQPFIVKTTHLDIEALGTVFTVKAYPNDSCITTTLEEGKVLVVVQDQSIHSTILNPNQQLIYSHATRTVKVRSVDISGFQKERSGYLIFENTSFHHLMASLERKFNVTIHYNSQKYAGEFYNVKFSPEESLNDVLNILKQLIGINYKVKGNVVFIN